MTRVVVAACVAAFALVGCGAKTVDQPAPSSAANGSVVEGLTEDEMCGLITEQSIEKSLGIAVEGSKGTRRGRMPVVLTNECRYESTGFPSFSTHLSTTRSGDSDQEVLDGVFTDRIKEAKPVGAYRKLPGLGVAAGFGRDPVVSQTSLTGWDLGVVVKVSGERLVVTLSLTEDTGKARNTGDAELKQLRPLAEQLLKNLGPVVS